MDIHKFIEVGANLEHERWSKWQRYMHSIGLRIKSGSLNGMIFGQDEIERWERQMVTPYFDLSEKEKESDRHEVRQYLPLIHELNREFVSELYKECFVKTEHMEGKAERSSAIITAFTDFVGKKGIIIK